MLLILIHPTMSLLRLLFVVVPCRTVFPSTLVAAFSPTVRYAAVPQRDFLAVESFSLNNEIALRTPRRHVVSPLFATIPIPPSQNQSDSTASSSTSSSSSLVFHPSQEIEDIDDDDEVLVGPPLWLEESFGSFTTADSDTSPPRVASPVTSSTPTTSSGLQTKPDSLVATEPESPTAIATMCTTTDRELSPLIKDILHRAKMGFYLSLRKLSPLAKDLLHRAKIGFYFGLWYVFNVAYNVYNKRVLAVWPAPLTLGSLQLGIGGLYAVTIWNLGLRKRPQQLKTKWPLFKVGMCNAFGQLCTMASLGAGSVAFTNIVKASEPFFSAGVSILVFGKFLHPLVYATLIPVVGGVGYACLNQPSFSLLACLTALGSNLFYSMRASLSKVTLSQSNNGKAVMEMSKKEVESRSMGTNLTPANIFALVTIASFFISVPFALVGEGSGLLASFSNALTLSVKDKNVGSRVYLVWAIFMSGLLHYINQDIMFFCLSKVHPVTLAVGNAIKRVILIMTAAFIFGNRVTSQVALGAGVSITGVLLYSIAQHVYENKCDSAMGNKAA